MSEILIFKGEVKDFGKNSVKFYRITATSKFYLEIIAKNGTTPSRGITPMPVSFSDKPLRIRAYIDGSNSSNLKKMVELYQDDIKNVESNTQLKSTIESINTNGLTFYLKEVLTNVHLVIGVNDDRIQSKTNSILYKPWLYAPTPNPEGKIQLFT